MERWRQVFRDGISPQLPLPALEALRHGLLLHDPRLRPGATVDGAGDISQACAIGYAAWKGTSFRTRPEISAFFEEVCAKANEVMEDRAAALTFIKWFDGHSREVIFPALLTEVNRAIAVRTSVPEFCTAEIDAIQMR